MHNYCALPFEKARVRLFYDVFIFFGTALVIMKSGYHKFLALLLKIPQLLPCGFRTCQEPAVGLLRFENCETSNECPVYQKSRPKLNLVAIFVLGYASVKSFNIPALCICGIKL